MALVVDGTPVEVPASSADAAALFGTLGEKFKLDMKVVTYLSVQLGLTSLEEFARLATTEDAIGEFVNKVRDLEHKELQGARLRMAWCGVREALASSASRKKRGDEAEDLDQVLPGPDLLLLKDGFWSRYKISFEPEEEPGDYLVSRLHKEINIRSLSIRDIWATKTQAHQVRPERRRSDSAEGSEFAEGKPPRRNLANYIRLHFVLMLAYGRAGALRLATAPEREPRGADSTLFVNVPFDILLRYHRRLIARANRLTELGEPSIPWITARDEAERSSWAKEFGNSTDATLGSIIKQQMDKRDTHWTIDEEAINERKLGSSARGRDQAKDAGRKRSRSRSARKKGGKGVEKGSGGKGKSAAKFLGELRNGTALCKEWNAGRCREPCPDGARHNFCNRTLQGSGPRCCGRPHRGMNCDNPKRS